MRVRVRGGGILSSLSAAAAAAGAIIIVVVLCGLLLVYYYYVVVFVVAFGKKEPFFVFTESVSPDMELVVVTSHYSEDLGWLRDIDLPVVVCSKTSPSPLCTQDENKGRETTSYLKFIADNYHRLPRHMAFVHGHSDAWHQKASVGLMDLIKNCAQYKQHGFISLNNYYFDDRRPENHAMQHLFRIWDDVFRPYLHRDPPQYLHHDCCAQFIVSRERVLSLPRDAYVHWYNYILHVDSTGDGGFALGLIFEYVWPILFGEPDVVGVPTHQARFSCGVENTAMDPSPL